MANICSFAATLSGAQGKIEKLRSFFNGVVAEDKNNYYDFIDAAGIDGEWPFIPAGAIFEVGEVAQDGGDAVVEIKGFERYVFSPAVIDALVKAVAGDGVEMIYSAWEPMLDYYESNDFEGRFYPDEAKGA